MMAMAKIFEELFTPTLNRIAVSTELEYQFLWLLLFGICLLRQWFHRLQRMKISEPIRKGKSRKWNTNMKIQSGSLYYARVNKSILYVTIIYASR